MTPASSGVASRPTEQIRHARVAAIDQKTKRMIRPGISLLEVIIATAILAASGVMLMSMFSTGDRHMRRAEKKLIAQMLCETKLSELLAMPTQIVPAAVLPIQTYPGWYHSIEAQPTSLEGFIQLTVSVTHIPGQAIYADLTPIGAMEPEGQFSGTLDQADLPEQPDFEIVRFIEFQGQLLSGLSEGSQSL